MRFGFCEDLLLSQAFKKGFQQGGTRLGQDAFCDQRARLFRGKVKDVVMGNDCPHPFVVRPINDAEKTALENGAAAHQARFQRHIQCAPI